MSPTSPTPPLPARTSRPRAVDAPDVPDLPSRPPGPVSTDPERRFGAHLRLIWWKPLVIIPTLLITLFVVQIALTLVVVTVEVTAFGRDPWDTSLSPAMMAAVNLSLAVMGPLSVLLTALIGRVPWRALLAFPRRTELRRWGAYFGSFTLLIALAVAATALVDGQSLGLSDFALTGTTAGLVAVALVSTPLQAAGEELMFRGALVPLIASWVRAVRPALVAGMVGSSILFGMVHMSLDPWLLSYYTVFGLCMTAMAVISCGLEAPIAFHVTNNLLMMVLGALFAGGGGLEIDRSVGMGGPFMLVFIAVDVAAVALVWLYERRVRP